jgi:hypothetical protein
MKKIDHVATCNQFAEQVIKNTFNICLTLNRENFTIKLNQALRLNKLFKADTDKEIADAVNFIWNEYIETTFDEYWDFANKCLTKEFITKSVIGAFKAQRKYTNLTSFINKFMNLSMNRGPWEFAMAVSMYSKGLAVKFDDDLFIPIINKYATLNGWDLIPQDYTPEMEQ